MPIQKLKPTFSFDEERLRSLEAVVPEVFADGRINWETLREVLGEQLENDEASAEHFGLFWPGKREARRLAAQPGKGALVPALGEGVDGETTENIFIEGDNLEVLKLLQKSYAGRIKLIYIDPPYNTGNDLIYKDNFAEPLDDYLKKTGQMGEEGDLLTTNTKESGRFHSNWLNMMYPRLRLANNLLRPDGVIAVSIDDNEFPNLRLLMNEVFGEENFIATLVWEKTRKNDAKLFSVGHEYILIYAHSISALRELKTVWREEKPGAKEIMVEYRSLRAKFGSDDEAVESALRQWYKNLPEKHASKKLSRYKHVDKYGPWRDRDISWPGGGGPTYDVPHPDTKKPCKVPERGWGFATWASMQNQIKLGLVVFRADHTQPPFRKAHLIPIPEELDDETATSVDIDESGEDEEELAGAQVMPSVMYKQSQVAVKYLRKLFGKKLFNNPKDHEVIARLIRYLSSAKQNEIILDCFAGSGTTAHSVMEANKEDNGNRKFVCVQLPEEIAPGEPAYKAGYRTISELAKKRIELSGQQIRDELSSKLSFGANGPDLGFKAFKLGASSFKAWQDFHGESLEKLGTLFSTFETPLVDGWNEQDVLTEILLLEGFPLNSSVGRAPEFRSNKVLQVESDFSAHRLFICLETQVKDKTIESLSALPHEDIFICLDSALDDAAKVRLNDVGNVRTI